MRQVLTCRGSRQQGAVLTPEARAERLGKTDAAIVGRAAAQADNQMPTPGVQRRLYLFAQPVAAGLTHIPLRWRREFEPTALRHLDNGPLAGQDQEIRLQGEAIRRGTALLLPHRPLKQRTIRQSRQQSLSAVGHGHFDQHQRLVNPAQSLGYRCASGLRATATFKRIQRDNNLHTFSCVNALCAAFYRWS